MSPGWLQQYFGQRVISLKTENIWIWPPHSPDLTPLDFSLWGYLKGRVYRNDPQNPLEVKPASSQARATENLAEACSKAV